MRCRLSVTCMWVRGMQHSSGTSCTRAVQAAVLKAGDSVCSWQAGRTGVQAPWPRTSPEGRTAAQAQFRPSGCACPRHPEQQDKLLQTSNTEQLKPGLTADQLQLDMWTGANHQQQSHLVRIALVQYHGTAPLQRWGACRGSKSIHSLPQGSGGKCQATSCSADLEGTQGLPV